MPSKRKHYTDAEWEEMICLCKASGLSDWHWCRENGISTSSFYRHLKKFHNATLAPLPDRLVPDSVPEIQEVVPLVIRDEQPAAAEACRNVPAVKITAHGISLDIYNNAGSDVISSIIRAVSSLC